MFVGWCFVPGCLPRKMMFFGKESFENVKTLWVFLGVMKNR